MIRAFFLWRYKARNRSQSKAFFKQSFELRESQRPVKITGNSNSFEGVSFGKYDIPGNLIRWGILLGAALAGALVVWFIWESIQGLMIFT